MLDSTSEMCVSTFVTGLPSDQAIFCVMYLISVSKNDNDRITDTQ